MRNEERRAGRYSGGMENGRGKGIWL